MTIHLHRSAGWLAMLFAVSLILLAGCSDDSSEPTAPTALTVTLTGSPDGGLVWFNDDGGAVLGCGEWSSDTTMVFDLGPDAPATVSATMATASDRFLSLRTVGGLTVGTEQTLDARAPIDPRGSVLVHVLNGPACDGVLMATQRRTHLMPSLYGGAHTIELQYDIADLFVHLSLSTGEHRGVWVPGVVDGQTVTLDYAQDGLFQDLTPRTVSLPAGTEDFFASLGTTADSGGGEGRIVLAMVENEEDAPTEAVLYAPAVADEELSLHLGVAMDSQGYYTMDTEGYVPEHFERLDGTLAVQQPEPARVQFSVTSAWDSAQVTWRQSVPDMVGLWYVTIPAPQTDVSLPRLPSEFVTRYPDFDREGFTPTYLAVEKDDGAGTTLGLSTQIID